MTAEKGPEQGKSGERDERELFIILSATGFEKVANARSALMFASLAAAAEFRTILFCIQNGVDIMVKGAIEKNEKPQPGVPTLTQRLEEAMEMGVEVQCCTQTMNNKKIKEEDLIPNVTAAGAMNLIDLTAKAHGTLCF
jgi:predicted peroxiredoxin